MLTKQREVPTLIVVLANAVHLHMKRGILESEVS